MEVQETPREKPYVLHMITPGKNASPFDANMAVDAGYQSIVNYVGVEVNEVGGLIQDAIFSRGPRGVWRTGIFIGGRDVGMAMDMLSVARKSQFKPFEVSMFADPSGAFTTSTAVIIKAESYLERHFRTGIDGKHVTVFGTGPVGFCVAVISARQGAKVNLIGYRNEEESARCCEEAKNRFQVDINYAMATSDEERFALVSESDVILNCSAAGVRVVSLDVLKAAPKLKVVIDINAVPPNGVEGVGSSDDGTHIAGLGEKSKVVAGGAMAIGGLKYHIQQHLFNRMMSTEYPIVLDFITGYEASRKHFV